MKAPYTSKKGNQSVVIPTNEKPYSNLAQAIKDSQVTTTAILDHEAFPDAQQEFVISTHKNRRLVEQHKKSKQGQKRQVSEKSVATPGNSTLLGRQQTLSQALSSKHNQIRYKVLHHIWGKNRKVIKNRNDKREKHDTAVSFEQFLAEDPQATR